MPTVYVDRDERYPDFLVADEADAYSTAVEVDEATLARWKKAELDYEQRHLEIAAALKSQTARAKA